MDNMLWKWEKLYLRAFMETKFSNLPVRIADAKNAIPLPTAELRTGSELEWQAIEDAIGALSILKSELTTPNELCGFRTLPVSNS
jgi:hypothetical protein